VISAELKFEGFDVRSWTNLISLFSPATVERMQSAPIESDAPELTRDERPPREGTLVVVLDTHEQVLKAFHTARGRVTDLEWTGKRSLPLLAETYGARRVVALTEGVMDEVSERLALRLQRGDDYVTQWLALARIIREMQEAGLMTFHPRPLANVPIPSAGTVRRALDVVLPDEHSAVFVLFERQRPWTSFALRRRRGSIDRVVGPDIVSRWVGPLGGDFRRDHRVVVESVSRSLAPVHFGLFTEVATARRLLSEDDPGRWAQAVAVRDVIVHPTPPYVAVALGADAVRGVARTTQRFLGGIDFFQAFGPITDALRSRVGEVASVKSLLGFDPLDALAAWLRRDREEGEASGDSVSPDLSPAEQAQDEQPG
jgi:hypothetical protein